MRAEKKRKENGAAGGQIDRVNVKKNFDKQ